MAKLSISLLKGNNNQIVVVLYQIRAIIVSQNLGLLDQVDLSMYG
jgi:hypothetical protein